MRVFAIESNNAVLGELAVRMTKSELAYAVDVSKIVDCVYRDQTFPVQIVGTTGTVETLLPPEEPELVVALVCYGVRA